MRDSGWTDTGRVLMVEDLEDGKDEEIGMFEKVIQPVMVAKMTGLGPLPPSPASLQEIRPCLQKHRMQKCVMHGTGIIL